MNIYAFVFNNYLLTLNSTKRSHFLTISSAAILGCMIKVKLLHSEVGALVGGCLTVYVLVIPTTVSGTETTLVYLDAVNLDSGDNTSILLSKNNIYFTIYD